MKPFVPLALPGFPALFDRALWNRAARIAHKEVKHNFEKKLDGLHAALPHAVAPQDFVKQ